MIVLDASVVIDLLLVGREATTIVDRVRAEKLAAPHLLDVEVAQVLRRFEATGTIDVERGREALRDLADLPLERFGHVVLLGRVWELRANFTAYDAVYVALAEALNVPLLTRDAKLAAAPGHRARIELIG